MKIYPLVKKVVSGGGGPNPTDAFSLKIIGPESNLAPTDASTFAIALLETDSNLAPTSGTPLLNIKVPGDSSTAPSDSESVTVRVWLSGTTMDSTNGVTSPANMDGQNNGTLATFQSAVAGDANPRTHSALGANIGSIAFTSAIYRGWFKSVNTLATSTGKLVMHSTTAAFTDITMFANAGPSTTVDHLTGDFTFDLVAAGVNTLAKLQSCQLLTSTSDAAAGVTPHVLTGDAGAIDLTGVF